MTEPRAKGSTRERLDVLCVEHGLAETRQRAQALILAGQVLVDGQVQPKAGTRVARTATIALRGEPMRYVSRGGLKLEAALDAFAVDCGDATVLDIGVSTGGFTDCVLQRGARHVFAVDVGYGQVAWKIRQDPRVTLLERTNARALTADQLRQAGGDEAIWPPTIATIDVSFISLTLILPAVAQCLGPDSRIVALVKPQFEAERSQIGKKGVVRDATARIQAIDKVKRWAEDHGYQVSACLDCPVPGPEGNVEHWLLLIPPTV